MKAFILLVLVAFLPYVASAKDVSEVQKIWQKPFGGDKNDAAYAVTATKDGGCAVAGSTRSMGAGKTDAIVLKMDAKGTIIWKKTVGKARKDQAEAIVETTDGYLVAAGSSKSFSENGNYDLFVMKLNQNGQVIWQKSFGGSGKDYARAIAKTNDGGVVIAGATKSFGKGSYDFYVIRLDTNGDKVWSQTYGGEDLDSAYGISATSDGGFIVVGSTDSYGAGNSDFYIIKIDAKGQEEWSQTYGEKKADVFYDVKELADGYALAGETRSYGSQKRDLSVMKIDKAGKILFHKLFGLKNHEYARGIAITEKQNILVAGVTKSMGNGRADFYLLELDNKSGELAWANVYGGKKNDIARGITKVNDGGFVIVGESESFNADGYDFYMLKLKL
ncbi:MAG: hypothetical protein K0U47_01345 [Epsilonproteobacteria bacterium]|nr:hypothetical protein [Campylobacterota bacterium]